MLKIKNLKVCAFGIDQHNKHYDVYFPRYKFFSKNLDLITYTFYNKNQLLKQINLDFIFNKSKVINYLMGTTSDVLIFPSDYNFSLEHKNNLILNFSESIKPKYFVDTHNILDIDKFSILYSKNDKNNVEKLLEDIDKNFQVEIFQNNKSI